MVGFTVIMRSHYGPIRDGGKRMLCSKCGSINAWKQQIDGESWVRCLCGHMRIYTSPVLVAIIPAPKLNVSYTLPKQNSKLWDCLMMLSGLAPASSDEITMRLNLSRTMEGETCLTTSDVTTQLSVLWRTKNLVEPILFRRGVPKGSTWRLTDVARLLMRTQLQLHVSL